MKILKTALAIIAVVIAVPLILALFVKKEYSVQRQIVIDRPKQEVYDYIKYLRNQNNYSKWAGMDPNMRKEFRGTDGTVGFISAWDSDKDDVGKGEQEITKIDEGRRIDYEIRFIKPFESVAPAYMITERVSDNQTKVTWGFEGHMPYPMNVMQLFMDLPGMIGNDLETGLNNLKNILKK